MNFRCCSIIFSFLFLNCVTFSNADVLFEDNFDGVNYYSFKTIDYDKWTSPIGDAAFFGQTAIRNKDVPDGNGVGVYQDIPQVILVEAGVAKLRLDTFNPTDGALQHGGANTTFWGSEMDTRQAWKPTINEGIRFEARVKNDITTPSGVISSLFGFGLTGNEPQNGNKDEVDFEFLSKGYVDGSPAVLVNSFKDEPYWSAGTKALLDADIDFYGFNTFRIDWYDDELQWFINDMFLYSQNVTLEYEMGLRLNTWVPNHYFGEAYDPTLLADARLEDNKTYTYEVDWARVSSFSSEKSAVVPEPATMILFGIGMVGAVLRRRSI